MAVFRSVALVFPKVNFGGAELASSWWKQLATEMLLKFALFGKGCKGRVFTTEFTIFLHIAQIEINIIHRKHSRNHVSMLWFVVSWLLSSS